MPVLGAQLAHLAAFANSHTYSASSVAPALASALRMKAHSAALGVSMWSETSLLGLKGV
jgi:hypothetical protein